MGTDRPKRVLIFAYFFPPLGGAGVQRIVKFAKYLPTLGWEPTIVTVRSRDYWMADSGLARELGPGVRIQRTRSLTGLAVLRRLAPRQAGATQGGVRASSAGIVRLRRLAGWVLIPDSYIGWVPYAIRAGEALLRERHYDCILTTSSPDSTHLIGQHLARRWRIPWVADFRDPWVRRLSFAPPTAWHRARHVTLERSILRQASRVTVTAEATRDDYLARYAELPREKVQVITNGYDEEDFAGLSEVLPARDTMQVLHAGQLNPERPARPFLLGLQRFLSRTPHARGRLRVRFLGPCYAGDLAAARQLALSDVVTFEAGRTHREIVSELLRSHLLLLMEQDSERGGLILPGKIFEYLRAERPILALLPPGTAWDLVAGLGAGRCVRTGDLEGCAQALSTYFTEYEHGGPPATSVAHEQLARFERRALAARLAQLMDSLT